MGGKVVDDESGGGAGGGRGAGGAKGVGKEEGGESKGVEGR